VLLQAAKYVENQCDAVEINLGCPQNIAKRGNYGAFLGEQWDVVQSLGEIQQEAQSQRI
jgi:tRNA-dihydrouridine synthase 1